MAELRQILKGLGKTPEGIEKRSEIISKYKIRLPELDYKLLYYTFVKNYSVGNICMKFIPNAESTYYNKLDKALARLEMLITDSEFREMTRLAKL